MEAHKDSVLRLQWLTVFWITIELTVAVTAGVKASSLALMAFGGDSAVELFSAGVVLRRFYLGAHTEQQSARITAALLYALAAFILVSSIAALTGKVPRAEPSYFGILFLCSAAVIMPWLGRR